MKALALAVALFAPALARADVAPTPGAPATKDADTKVTVTIRVIEAKQQGPKQLDPRLADLEKRLTGFSYSQYKLLEERRFELDLHTPAQMELPGARHLLVTPRRIAHDDKIKVHLELTGGTPGAHTRYLHTDYAIQKGATLLVGGPKTEDGTLFIALRHDAK